MKFHKFKIAVIGLGYVGLPLALAFSKKYQTIGFDINTSRISQLVSGVDTTLEIEKSVLAESELRFTAVPEDISSSNFYVVTVPTPITSSKEPNLNPLISACKLISKILKMGDYVIFESTVYPGATEEICVPILEKSGLKLNANFYVGYSPERINPGDKTHRLSDIVKVTSGSNQPSADVIDTVYKTIISAGTHKATSIKVAEAAKVIENIQRDINIGLINELALIFDRLDIETNDVLAAASTKWNFLNFKPGLVGGHCIGVDPYYLTHKAQTVGYRPELILSGRRINDNMATFVVNRLIREMIARKISIHDAKILILGVTFKENCPDIRNTKVIDIITGLKDMGISCSCYDPWADVVDVNLTYGVNISNSIPAEKFDAIILAVEHEDFANLDIDCLRKKTSVVYDLKNMLSHKNSDIRL